jgi:hypothetical protein
MPAINTLSLPRGPLTERETHRHIFTLRSSSHNSTGAYQDRKTVPVVTTGGETDVCVLAAVVDAVAIALTGAVGN